MSQTRFDDSFAPIAVAERSGLDESLHHGAGVAIDADGAVVGSVGDPDVVVYPRSALKPLQTDALIAAGLDLPPELLAVTCASHSGEPMHLDAVRRILALHGLDEDDLRNTPARPHGVAARSAARAAGVGPSSLQQNCSGKHAAMLATCRVNGWSVDDYLDTDHPVQAAITAHIDAMIAAPAVPNATSPATVAHIGVDGCGAPTHAFSLRALAGAFSRLVRRGSAVATAMSGSPDLVGGTDRDVSTWMRAVPGLVAKEGADGVMAAALPDGRAVAFKIADGSDLARRAVTLEALRMLGVDTSTAAWAEASRAVEPVVLGHGLPVGRVGALYWTT